MESDIRIKDFLIWDVEDKFDVYDAACLWNEIDPFYLKRNGFGENLTISFCKIDGRNSHKIKTVCKTFLKRFSLMGDPSLCPEFSDSGEFFPIPRHLLVDFAEEKCIRPLFLFPEDRPKEFQRQYELPLLRKELEQAKTRIEQLEQETTEKEPYLDSNHKYFAHELEAAVSAWKALYVEGEYKEDSPRTHKQQLGEWLNRNKNKTVNSEAAFKRIKIVSNPNKIGGVKATL